MSRVAVNTTARIAITNATRCKLFRANNRRMCENRIGRACRTALILPVDRRRVLEARRGLCHRGDIASESRCNSSQLKRIVFIHATQRHNGPHRGRDRRLRNSHGELQKTQISRCEIERTWQLLGNQPDSGPLGGVVKHGGADECFHFVCGALTTVRRRRHPRVCEDHAGAQVRTGRRCAVGDEQRRGEGQVAQHGEFAIHYAF